MKVNAKERTILQVVQTDHVHLCQMHVRRARPQHTGNWALVDHR